MSEEETKKGGCMKVLGVMLVIGLVGTVLAGAAGTYLYFNWEKLGLPGMDELKAKVEESAGVESTAVGFAGAESSGGETAATAEDGEPQAIVADHRRVVASAPLQGTAANLAQWTQRRDVLVLVDYYADW